MNASWIVPNSQCKVRRSIFLLATLLTSNLAIVTSPMSASQVDLLLDIEYGNLDVPGSGGSWRLYARTSDYGLCSLSLVLLDVQGPLEIGAPRGYTSDTPLGSFSLGAGFAITAPGYPYHTSGILNITLSQSHWANAAADTRQRAFYGVGTVPNGHIGSVWPPPIDEWSFPQPYPDPPILVTGMPWAATSPTAGWETAALMLGGAFSGINNGYYEGPPAFYEGSDQQNFYQATVFGTLPESGIFPNPSPYPYPYFGMEYGAEISLFVLTNQPLLGDFNDDGAVNAADYSIWRDTDNSVEGYQEWKANFGANAIRQVVPGLWQAVPEPASLSVATAVAFMCSIKGRGRRNWITFSL